MFQPYLRLLMAAGALLLSATITNAQTVAYDAVVQPGNQGFTGNLGLDFDVTRPIAITALGVFDNNGDGFAGNGVSMAIFNRTTMTPVSLTTSFTTGFPGTLVNGDRFKTW